MKFNQEHKCWKCGFYPAYTRNHLIKDPVLDTYTKEYLATGTLAPGYMEVLENSWKNLEATEDVLKKTSVEKDGNLFCKSASSEDGQQTQVADGLENSESLSVFKERNLLLLNPVLDRFSPLSYAIAEHIHNKVMKHKGYETCYSCSQDHVFLIQGMNLFRVLGE